MFGKRSVHFLDNINIIDHTNQMFAQIRLNPFKKGVIGKVGKLLTVGLLFKAKHRSDHFQ